MLSSRHLNTGSSNYGNRTESLDIYSHICLLGESIQLEKFYYLQLFPQTVGNCLTFNSNMLEFKWNVSATDQNLDRTMRESQLSVSRGL